MTEEAYGRPVRSASGSASMSARRSTVGPSPLRSRPTTPVRPTPAVTSYPSAVSRRAISAAVRCSAKDSSGWACRSWYSSVRPGSRPGKGVSMAHDSGVLDRQAPDDADTVQPMDPSTEPPNTLTDPRELLLAYLDYYRATVLRKLDGMSDDDLRRSRLPSGWTPLELLKHLAFVERRWLRWGFTAEQVDQPWGDEDPDTGRWQVRDDESADEVRALFLDECARSREVVARVALGDISRSGGRFNPPDRQPALSWILFHVLQEYARRAGHRVLARLVRPSQHLRGARRDAAGQRREDARQWSGGAVGAGVPARRLRPGHRTGQREDPVDDRRRHGTRGAAHRRGPAQRRGRPAGHRRCAAPRV